MGLDCRYCHASVEVSPVANVPPTAVCMNCHKLVKRDSPLLEPIRSSASSGHPMQWVRVHKLPDYVYFNHKVHIAAGVGCVSCHGRIDEMDVVTQMQPLSMSWCLDCHRNAGPNRRPVSEVHQHEVDSAQGRESAGGEARAGSAPSIRHRVLRVPPMKEHDVPRDERREPAMEARPGREYWRSLRQKQQDPAFLEVLAPRVPGRGERAARRHDAARHPDAARRVDLARGARRLPAAGAPHRPVRRASRDGDPGGCRSTTRRRCRFGRAAYGLVVESHEGHPTKIEGNPRHPGSQGASSVRAQAAILNLYDPDRGQSLLQGGNVKKWPDFVAAWKEIEKAHLADGGAGLAILSESFASPTLARLRSVLLNRFPKATWAVWGSRCRTRTCSPA
jgi:hypothetical protein